MSNNAGEPSVQALYISKLDVKLSEQSRKRVTAVKLQTRNKTLKEFQAPISPNGCDSKTFIPALELQPSDSFSVSVQFLGRTKFLQEEVKITMDHHEILSGAQGMAGTKTYEKTERKINVILSLLSPRPTTTDVIESGLPQLRPTTIDTIESCPQFRILIIGNSGVGKTSLIKKMFGVNEVHIDSNKRGEAEIDTAFVSSQNERFVLHDSRGFEEGDTDNVEIVKQFVKRHKDQPQIKDRLHAVWLCLEIPYSGGRLLESGAEIFLQRRREVIGDVPLVVVLTKVDLLDNQLEIDMMEDDSDGKSFGQLKSEFLEEHCLKSLRAAAEDVPHVIVSTQVPQSTMFADVVKITTDRVSTNIGEEASIAAAMAQRVNIKVNIESSIAIGKKKYWSMLAKSAVFPGYTLKECVQVLHSDIVAVWNFYDPEEILQHDDFIGALVHTADLEQPASAPIDFSPVLGAAQAIFGSSSEPHWLVAASIVGAALWLGKLAHEIYKRTNRVISLFMLYIVSVMFVMQVIFLLAPEGHVTRKVVDHAIYYYSQSATRRVVRERIDGFVHGLLIGGPDYVLKELEAIIESCSITRDDQVKELREAFLQLSESEGARERAG